MSNYFYTAIIQEKTNAIEFAEHFVSENERNKRAKQLLSECIGRGESAEWKCYSGDESPEAFLARQSVKPKKDESPEDFVTRQEDAASKAKTVSVLTDPEVDDSEEKRPLPDWAIAQNDLDKALQALNDAKAAADALKSRSDNLAEIAYSRNPEGKPKGPEETKEATRAALSAQAEADYAAARLYHAEQDYLAKAEIFKGLFDASQKRSKEDQKK